MDRFALPDDMAFLDDQVSIATSYLSAAITRLTCFDALHASTSSDDFISVHNDVQVWLRLATLRFLCRISKRGHPRVDSFSAASFSDLCASFWILTVLYTLLATVYFVVVSRRCMMQPIIFLMLNVVSLS
jgi:hypothetical protein